MTLDTTGYTVGSNYPLNHARILWDHVQGTVTADGTNGDFAANDYTAQRWSLAAGANDWTLTLGAAADVDTMFISAHNLSGITFRPQYLGDDVTNLLTYSEQFDNAAWVKLSNVTITADAGVAPDGTTTADQHAISAASARLASQTVAVSTLTTYTFSVYAKRFSGSGGFTIELFGSSSGSTTSIVALSDEWVRYTVTKTTDGTDATLRAGFFPTTSGDEVLIWGAQLQTGTEATSYIKTEATAVTSGWRDLASWITPTDNSTIAILANDASGNAYNTTGVRLAVGNATASTNIGIIRAGEALQMERPFYGGYAPIRLSRITEGQQSFSETGQWIGRTEKRRALSTTYSWQYLSAAWYRANFDPFAQTLPLKPFGIAGNPLRMAEDVAWVWVQNDPAPSNMGLKDLMQVSLKVTGYFE